MAAVLAVIRVPLMREYAAPLRMRPGAEMLLHRTIHKGGAARMMPRAQNP